MLIIFLIILSIFLTKELLKKFRFMKSFFHSCPYTTSRHYDGKRIPDMYNIVFKSEKPFSLLVGFELNIPIINYSGYDPYGFVSSWDTHQIVISTYLGKEAIDFQFFTSIDPKYITISSTKKDQELSADITYPPHRRQRLWIFS